MLPELHTDFSRGRSGGLVFPSLRIFQFIVIHTVKGFGTVNKAEIDVFLELSCFFNEPVDVGKKVGLKLNIQKTKIMAKRSEWQSSKCLQIVNAGEGVEKREPSYTVGGNAN